jgi:bacteriorhodopsin
MFVELETRSSLNSNPSVAPIDITTRGSDWAWTVFAIMTVSALGMIVFRHLVRPLPRNSVAGAQI